MDVSTPSYQQVTYRRGKVSTARFAPDGATFVYSASWEGRPQEIFTARFGNPDARGLGDGGGLPARGGRQRRDDRRPPGRGRESGTLARVSLTGGPLRDVLTDFGDADWSPRRVRDRDHALRGRGAARVPGGHDAAARGRGASATRASRPTASGSRSSSTRSWPTTAGWSRWSTGRASGRSCPTAGPASRAWPGRRTAGRSGSPPLGRERLCGLHAVDLAGRPAHDHHRAGPTGPPGHRPRRTGAAGQRAETGRGLRPRSRRRGGDLALLARLLLRRRPLAGRAPGPAVRVGRGRGAGLRRLPPGTPTARRRSAWARGRPFALSPDGAWALTMPLDPPERLVLLPTGAGEERTLPLEPLVNVQFAELVPRRREAAPPGERARATPAAVRAVARRGRAPAAHHSRGRRGHSPAA